MRPNVLLMLLGSLLIQVIAPTNQYAQAAGVEYFESPSGEIYHWDKCRVIGIRADMKLSPNGSLKIVKEAIEKIRTASDLPLEFLGTIDEASKDLFDEDGFARDSQIIISWAKRIEGTHSSAGIANLSFRGKMIISSSIFLKSTLKPNWDVYGLGNVLLHELGHSVGLGHSSLKSEIMYPNAGAKKLGKYDLIGLKKVGSFPCLPYTFEWPEISPNIKVSKCEVRENTIKIDYSFFAFGGQYKYLGILYGRGKNTLLPLTTSESIEIHSVIIEKKTDGDKYYLNLFPLLSKAIKEITIENDLDVSNQPRYVRYQIKLPNDCGKQVSNNLNEPASLNPKNLLDIPKFTFELFTDENGNSLPETGDLIYTLDGLVTAYSSTRICSVANLSRIQIWADSGRGSALKLLGSISCDDLYLESIKLLVPKDTFEAYVTGVDKNGRLISYFPLRAQEIAQPIFEINWYQKSEMRSYMRLAGDFDYSPSLESMIIKVEIRTVGKEWQPVKITYPNNEGSFKNLFYLDLPNAGPADFRITVSAMNSDGFRQSIFQLKPLPTLIGWRDGFYDTVTNAKELNVSVQPWVPRVVVSVLTFEEFTQSESSGRVLATLTPIKNKSAGTFGIPFLKGSNFYILEISETATTAKRIYSANYVTRN